MQEIDYNDAVNQLSNEELAAFEAAFLEWLFENSEAVQAGGAGHIESLAKIAKSWVAQFYALLELDGDDERKTSAR